MSRQEVHHFRRGSWSTSFLLRRSGYISCVHWPFSVSSHLSFHMSFRNSSTFLSCDISSCLLESLSCCVFIAFIAICKSSGGVSVTICKLSTGVIEYALYILRRSTTIFRAHFLKTFTMLYNRPPRVQCRPSAIQISILNIHLQ